MDRFLQETRKHRERRPWALVAWPGGGRHAALLALVVSSLAWLAGCAQAGEEGGDRGAAPLGKARLADTTPAAPTWIGAAPLSVPRAHHTATRLLDGRVLVAGGRVDTQSAPLASAEIYDPATGAWTPAASMGSARHNHGAELLSNGKVFVHGGYAGPFDHALGTAEIYDPAADRWTAVAPTPTPRFAYVATPLLDGRLLVTGGRPAPSSGELSSCAIYDPALDAWSDAGSMNQSHYLHVAVRLLDGRVLVAQSYRPVEIYDPAADTWTLTPFGRDFGPLVLLSSGEVLAAGSPWGESWTYDPAADTWTDAPGMLPVSASMDGLDSHGIKHREALLLPGGRVLVLGGVETMASGCITWSCEDAPWPTASFYPRVEVYDAATRSWSVGPDMLSGRGAHTATRLLDGSVLVTGGYNQGFNPPGEWLSLTYVATSSVERLTGVSGFGAPCSSDLDCGGLACADGVCCDAACDGPCEACSIAAGGAADGVCSPLTGPACDDGNACTQADACLAGACAGAPVGDGAPCDDGDACTQADACQAGACAGAPVGDGAPCDDGDACTQTDACQAGACAGAAPVSCAAPADGCSASVCDPATGRCERALSPWGAPCDDGSACTQGDTCDAGACVHETSVVCQASAPCKAAACDAATGECLESPQPDGTPCDDGDGCTVADACQVGACVGGAPVTCPVPTSCYAPGACSSPYGSCGLPVLLPDGAPCPDPTSAAWTPASSLEGAGEGRSATRLQDGTVLVAGGLASTPEGTVARRHSAVRYDPTTDAWTPTGAMIHARADHTATLLQDGTVLVIGGNEPASAETEIYDPATGVWTAAAPTNAIRREHTATLLPSGKVLVAGGAVRYGSNDFAVASAEVYDRAANTWTPAAPMDIPRSGHSAILLSDGRVLVINNKLGSGHTELYDPVTDTWTYGPFETDMSLHLGWHTATLLADGKVFVLGGSTLDSSSVAVRTYDPASDRWTSAPHSRLSCTWVTRAGLLTDGRVLVLGCNTGVPSVGHATALLYDPVSSTWSFAPSLSDELVNYQLTRLLDDRVLLTSCSTDRPDCTALLYAPGGAVPGEGACSLGVCMALDGGGAGGAGAAGGGDTSSGSGAGGDASGGGGAAGASSSAAAGGDASGGGGEGAASSSATAGGGEGATSSSATAGGGGGDTASSSATAGGGGEGAASSSATAGGVVGASGTSSGHGGSGASPPGHHGDGNCSLSRSPAGSTSGTPWLLLATLLAARRNAPRRRALRPPVAR
ncbi:kelch repeat-containing protein [Sorangium sp. So ce260]|uniref:kelch repeat-containing protein n=1 Tax=Sorangium sp. So ce260 TaxID=3133291 RepID=UPI003F5DF0CA